MAANLMFNDVIKYIKDQIVRLKERLKFAEAALEDKSSIENSFEEIAEAKSKLENVHVRDKALIKYLENQVADFRSNLLKAKSDKSKISQKNKEIEKELLLVTNERNEIKLEVEQLKEDLKARATFIQSKEIELTRLKNEVVEQEAKLKGIMGDLETKMENKSLISKFCDKTSTVKLEITNHIQHHRQEDVSSQTEEELLTEEAKPKESGKKLVNLKLKLN